MSYEILSVNPAEQLLEVVFHGPHPDQEPVYAVEYSCNEQPGEQHHDEVTAEHRGYLNRIKNPIVESEAEGELERSPLDLTDEKAVAAYLEEYGAAYAQLA